MTEPRPIRAKCLGCQTVAVRTEYETTASALLLRIRCATCGDKRIASVAEGGVEMEEAEREYLRSRSEPPPLRDIRVPEPDVPIEGEELSEEQLRAELGEEVVEPPSAPPGRLEAGLAASDASGSAGWSEEELATVKRAILAVADRLDEFTADDVWTELGSAFPVTKGIAGRLNAAAKAGVIEATGRVGISQREGEHGHGQRLGIWRSLRRPA